MRNIIEFVIVSPKPDLSIVIESSVGSVLLNKERP